MGDVASVPNVTRQEIRLDMTSCKIFYRFSYSYEPHSGVGVAVHMPPDTNTKEALGTFYSQVRVNYRLHNQMVSSSMLGTLIKLTSN